MSDWQVVTKNNYDRLERVEVPGGHLYRTVHYSHGSGDVMGVAMCFVPEQPFEVKPVPAGAEEWASHNEGMGRHNCGPIKL